MAILVFPFFTILISSIFEAIDFKTTSEVFDNELFTQLLKLDFKNLSPQKNNRFLTSKPLLTGIHNNYLINIELEKGIVRVIVDANLDKVKRENMNDFKKCLEIKMFNMTLESPYFIIVQNVKV